MYMHIQYDLIMIYNMLNDLVQMGWPWVWYYSEHCSTQLSLISVILLRAQLYPTLIDYSEHCSIQLSLMGVISLRAQFHPTFIDGCDITLGLFNPISLDGCDITLNIVPPNFNWSVWYYSAHSSTQHSLIGVILLWALFHPTFVDGCDITLSTVLPNFH